MPLCLVYRRPELSLDHALSVLSRALECNKHNKELWVHYLGLYSRRDDSSDLMELCEQGLQYAPSYELHWKVGPSTV